MGKKCWILDVGWGFDKKYDVSNGSGLACDWIPACAGMTRPGSETIGCTGWAQESGSPALAVDEWDVERSRAVGGMDSALSRE